MPYLPAGVTLKSTTSATRKARVMNSRFPHEDEATIGERLRAVRQWRGMSLAEVAGLAGLSAPYLSMAERGLRTVDRRSTLSALAAALRVSETDLTGGPHLGTDPEQSAPHAAIPALRVALQANSLSDPADRPARRVADLASEWSTVKALHYSKCDFVGVGERLPALIDELHVRASPAAAGSDRVAALGLLVEVSLTAAFVAKNLSYPDLAHIAALRSQEAARLLGDPVAAGKAAFARFHTAPQSMTGWERAFASAEHAAAALEPHVSGSTARDRQAISVLGLLTLSAAFAAAVLQREPAADHWFGQAVELAARVPDDMSANWQSFCVTNVSLWRIALAIERGHAGGKITELSNEVDESRVTTRTRHADFLVDVGRGVARDPKAAAEAVAWLRRAEELAPQRVRNYAPAREAVAYLLTRARTQAGGRELRGMAARMGIAH
jgi:transcriptional regulator with XRE-family HTH domain